MSFLRKVSNYAYLKAQHERISAFAPLAAALGVPSFPDGSFVHLPERALDCRRWTLEEANEWRLRVLALATEARDGAPTVGMWSDTYMNPLMSTIVCSQVETFDYKTVTTGGHWENIGGGVLEWQGTVEKKKTLYSLGNNVFVNMALPRTLAVVQALDEHKLIIEPNQFAADVPTILTEALPNLEGTFKATIGGLSGTGVAGFLSAHLVYDESIDEPAQLEGYTRLYSARGYYGNGTAQKITELLSGNIVLHKKLGVATVQMEAVEAEESGATVQIVVTVSRHAYGYTHVANESVPPRWQGGISAHKIGELEALGMSLYLFRVGDARSAGSITDPEKVRTDGLLVSELLECGSHYLIRGVQGAVPLTAGTYSLCVMDACAAVHMFSDSHMGNNNYQKIRSQAYPSWHCNYRLSSGSLVETKGKVQRVFATQEEQAQQWKQITAFENPAAAIVTMLSEPFTSALDVLKVKYAALVWREVYAVPATGRADYLSGTVPTAADGVAAKHLVLDDGTVCAVGRYSAAAEAVDEQALLWRCKLYTPHGNPLSAKDGTLAYNPVDSWCQEQAWYVDGVNQPVPATFLLTRWWKLGILDIVASFGRKYTFTLGNPQVAPPDAFVTVEDGYADLTTVLGAAAYKLTPNLPNAPTVVETSDSGTRATTATVLTHRDGDKLLLTKHWLLEPAQPKYIYYGWSTDSEHANIFTVPGSTSGPGSNSNITQKISYGDRRTETNRAELTFPELLYQSIYRTVYTETRPAAPLNKSRTALGMLYIGDVLWQDILFSEQMTAFTKNYTGDIASLITRPSERYADDVAVLPAAGESFSSAPPSGRLAKSVQQWRPFDMSAVQTSLDSGNTHIIGLNPFFSGTRGYMPGSSDGAPMELFPLTPVALVYQFSNSNYGYGLGVAGTTGVQPTMCVRLCMVGHTRKVIHGESQSFSCYNKCPERGTVATEVDGVFYTPKSVGFDLIIGIPEDPLAVPVILPVYVVSATSESVPELLYTATAGVPPFNQLLNSPMMTTGVAFPTATTADGVTSTRWRVGLDHYGNTAEVVYSDIVTYHTKLAVVALPAAAVLAQLFVPSEDVTFDIPVGVEFPEHAAQHLFLQISCGVEVGVNPLALVRPILGDGQIIFRVNKGMFTPTAAKLLAPLVFFRLVDSRWLTTIHVVSVAHP